MTKLLIDQAVIDQALEALVKADSEPGSKAWEREAEAITALRQAKEQPTPPPECKTEAEKTAFGFGWWKALESQREQSQQAETVAWTDLLKEADEIVRGKVLWKRFIDGTPLANDIAVWMADFAQQHTSPPKRKPLTDEQIEDLYFDKFSMSELKAFARAIEAAHGIKGEA